jgi:hypothetical protein
MAAGMDDYIVKPVTLDRLAVAPAAGAALERDMLDQLREDLEGTAALRDLPSTGASYCPRPALRVRGADGARAATRELALV